MPHYKARYRQAPGEYAGNGWIEALPPRRSRSDLEVLFRQEPSYDPADRSLPYEQRRDLIDQISTFYWPFAEVMDLADGVMSLMQRGYAARSFPAARVDGGTDPEVLDMDYHTTFPEGSRLIPSLGMIVIGPSGTGKTSATMKALEPIPQVIRHGTYQGRDVQQIQVTYIKITSPGDSSTKSVCKSILRELDRVAGTRFERAYLKSRTTTEDLVDSLPHVCRSVGLGLLVLDELQHLSSRMGGGGERIMNDLVSLSDNAHIPILYIGTYKAEKLVGREFRHARRGCSFGAIEWKALQRGAGFEDFVRALWRYQYIRHATPEPTEELLTAFYEHTQGIADLIVKLFMLGQVIAIIEETEAFSTGLLAQTSAECLGPMQPILRALRNGDRKALAAVDDVRPIDFAKSAKQVEEGRGIRLVVDEATRLDDERPPTRPPPPLQPEDPQAENGPQET
jgi:hypothetical protein